MLSYHRETALQGALVLAKSGRLELGDSILGHYRPAKLSNSVKNAKLGLLRRSRLLKVIDVGTNQKPVCDFLLMINSN